MTAYRLMVVAKCRATVQCHSKNGYQKYLSFGVKRYFENSENRHGKFIHCCTIMRRYGAPSRLMLVDQNMINKNAAAVLYAPAIEVLGFAILFALIKRKLSLAALV